MRSLFSTIGRFLSELRRRNVYQVAVTYVVVGFFVIEGADLTLTRLGLPPWTVTFVIVLVGLGFPIALVLAWALEVTPEGVRVEENAAEATESSEEGPAPTSTTRDLWVGASVLVLLLLGTWWLFDGVSPQTDSDPVVEQNVDSTRVAVFPFTVRGGPELSYLGEGMVDLLTVSIDGAGPLKTVDPKAVLARVNEARVEGLSPSTARRIAARLGAGRFVLGSLLKVGDELRMSATWYGASGHELGSVDVEGQGEDDVQQMVDELARTAIADLTGGQAERRHRLAAQTTASSEALKRYLEGQEALRGLDYARAVKNFSEAVREDSSFALAHYRLSLALGWTGRDSRRAYDHVQQAEKYSEDLPERDRRVIRATTAYSVGNAETAERLYRTVLQRYPNDVTARYALGEVLFHFNGVRGRAVTESRKHFRRAMQVDSSFTVALPHRIHIAASERDTTRLDSLTRGLNKRRLAPGAEAQFRVIRAYLLSDGASEQLKRQLLQHPVRTWMTAYGLGAAGELKASLELLRPLIRPERTDQLRAAALTLQADVLVAKGRLQAARQKISQVAPLDSAAYWMARSRLAGLPFLPKSPESPPQRRVVRRGLKTWDADAAPERLLPTLFLTPRRLYPLGRRYRLGILHAMAGDPDAALEVADQLSSMEPFPLAASAPVDFARSIQAEVAHHRDNPERALANLRRRENRADPLFIMLDPLSAARERFLRAELLARQGSYKDALRWYRTLNGLFRGELPYLAPAHLGRARVLEQLGRPEEAAATYRRALEIWENPDPIFQPRVEAAQQQLADLVADTTTVSVLGTQTPE